MNILGMGPMEIVLIVVLALIVFGPAKLPQIMGQVGKAIADFRRATSELSDEFNRTIQAELQETRAVVDDTKAAVTGVHTSINSALTGAPAPVRTAVPDEAVPVGSAPTATESAANGTNGTNGTARPPLADTSQWSWETAAPAPARPAVEIAAESTPAVAPVAAPESPAPEPPAASPAPAPEPPAASREAPKPARRGNVRNEILPPY